MHSCYKCPKRSVGSGICHSNCKEYDADCERNEKEKAQKRAVYNERLNPCVFSPSYIKAKKKKGVQLCFGRR